MTDPYPLSTVLPASKPPRRRRWVAPVLVAAAAAAVGTGVGILLTGRGSSPVPAAAPTTRPATPKPVLSAAAACIQAVQSSADAVEIINAIDEDLSGVDVALLDRTVLRLQDAQPFLPSELQSYAADIVGPLVKVQESLDTGNPLTVQLVDFKAGSLALVFGCGEYVPDHQPGPEPGTIDEGVWTVGGDIRPGRYRTTEVVDSDCYWSITKSGTNGDDIIANDIPGGGRPTVTLRKGQDFTTHRCGTWTRLK